MPPVDMQEVYHAQVKWRIRSFVDNLSGVGSGFGGDGGSCFSDLGDGKADG